jgi:hypothetical protein
MGKVCSTRATRRWEVDINMDHREVRWGWYGVESCGSGYGPVAGSCEHVSEPSGP